MRAWMTIAALAFPLGMLGGCRGQEKVCKENPPIPKLEPEK